MIVRSHIITRETIGAAVCNSDAPYLFLQDTHSREGRYEPIREFLGRDGRPAFEFFLAGSSPYRAQHDIEEFAATWTEWGIVIDDLFHVDPHAQIGHYSSHREFLQSTDVSWKSHAEKPWLYSQVSH